MGRRSVTGVAGVVARTLGPSWQSTSVGGTSVLFVAACLTLNAVVYADPPTTPPPPCPCGENSVHQVPAGLPANRCDADWRIGIDPSRPDLSAVRLGPYRLFDGGVGYNNEAIRTSMCWHRIQRELCPNASRPGPGQSLGGNQSPEAPSVMPDGSDLFPICEADDPQSAQLNVSLLAPPSIGDFPPPSPTIGGSTVPLLPDAVLSTRTSWDQVSRPTLEGKVDLVTGIPLAQFVDLELPITGGTYRLTRTRSAATGRVKMSNGHAVDRWWDWAGQGWMVNEQPFLWIDSALPDVVGNNPRTTYLVLDAFHSIPFQLIESSGQYEAPARFKAKIKHDGVWNPQTRWWQQSEGGLLRPRRYTISLYDGALTYSFAAIYEDIPARLVTLPTNWGFPSEPGRLRSLHQRPLLLQQLLGFPDGPVVEGYHNPWDASNPGVGAPYYGLCTRIESAHGHRVELEYCDVTQRALDNTASTCTECMGDCGAKGQLRSVSVFAPDEQGNEQLQWKLFYKYRATPEDSNIINTMLLYMEYYAMSPGEGCPCHQVCAAETQPPCADARPEWAPFMAWCDKELELIRRTSLRTIDSIFVYDWTKLTPQQRTEVEQLSWCDVLMSLSSDASYVPAGESMANGPGDLADIDSGDVWANPFMASGSFGPSQWSRRVRYHYVPKRLGTTLQDGQGDPVYDLPNVATLIKSTVFTKEHDGEVSTRATIFGYENFSFMSPGQASHEMDRPLASIWQPADVASTLGAVNDLLAGCNQKMVVNDLVWASQGRGLNYNTTCAAKENAVRDLLKAGPTTRYEFNTSGFTNVSEFWGSMQDAPSHTMLHFEDLHTKPVGRSYLRSFPLESGSGPAGNRSPLRPHIQYGSGTTKSTMVSTLTTRATGTDARHYRVFRLVAVPEAFAWAEDAWNPQTSQSLFQPAMFFAPYAWWGYPEGYCGSSQTPCDVAFAATRAPDYREVRWVTVIDEFSDRQSLDSTIAYGVGGQVEAGLPTLAADVAAAYMIKPGQISRRVVEISPSGVVLRDRSWQFDLTGVNEPLVSGQGLGQEYIYETVEKYFGTTSGNQPPQSGESGGIYAPQGSSLPIDLNDWIEAEGGYVGYDDPWASTRKDLLLVEHRSIGWSAVDVAHTGPGDSAVDDGFTRFYEYVLRHYDSTPETSGTSNATHVDGWQAGTVFLPTLIAEGVKRGRVYSSTPDQNGKLVYATSAQPRLYTRQYFRALDPALPSSVSQWSELETDVAFTTPQDSKLAMSEWPQPGTTPPAGIVATHRLANRVPPASGEEPRALPDQRVDRTLSVGPPQQLGPSGAAHYAISATFMDSDGRTSWMASGLVLNPLAPGGAVGNQSLSWSRILYDHDSRVLHSIVDVAFNTDIPLHQAYPRTNPNEEPVISQVEIGVPPVAWPRMAPDGDVVAKNYVTSYLYYGPLGGVSDIFHPNGRRWARRVVTVGTKDWLRGGENADGRVVGGVPQEPYGNTTQVSPIWNSTAFSVLQSNPNDSKWQILYSDDKTDLKYLSDEESFAREFTFEHLEESQSGGVYVSHAEGTIRDYFGGAPIGNPVVDRRVIFAVPTELGSGGQDEFSLPASTPSPIDIDDFTLFKQPRFTLRRSSQLTLDSDGRPIQVDLATTGVDGSIASEGSVSVNDLVDLIRVRAVDGSITRSIRDLMGQVIRKYEGTDDTNWSESSVYGSTISNNLVLTERTQFGTGVADAFLPTHQLRYARLAYQTTSPWGPAVQNDPGYVTRTHYDWRMRPTRVDTFDVDANGAANASSAARVETTLTYFDHLDRPHTVVRYGRRDDHPAALDLAGIDPTYQTTGSDSYYSTYDKTDLLVPIHEFFRANQRPLSVERMIYGADGSVTERRRYDVSANPTSQAPNVPYHSDWTYAAGGAAFNRSPESPATTTVTDAMGRPTTTTSTVDRSSDRYELERSVSIFDADGLLADSRRLERTLDQFAGAGSPALSAEGANPNAARSRSVFWYDAKKRQIANAHLGTESATGLFGPPVAQHLQYSYPLNNPQNDLRPRFPSTNGVFSFTPEIPAGLAAARIGIEHYDSILDKLILRRETNGTITAFKYYPSGRVSHEIENYSPTNTANRRVTKYHYDNMGRLEKYEVSTGDQPTQRQITRVKYGAEVVGEVGVRTATTGAYGLDYEVISRTNSQVGKMWLPHPSSGAAQSDPTTPDLTFRYTIDGKIAERIDARGVSMKYFYDALGRVLQVRVGHYPEGNTQPTAWLHGYPDAMSPIGATPVDRIGSVNYVYNNRGQLERVTARGPPPPTSSPNTPGPIISENLFRYDLRGNLLKDVQKIDGAITVANEPTTPTTSYAWSYQPSSATAPGHDRLTSITYPLRPNANWPRVLNILYGPTPGIDDELSRIAGFSTTTTTPGSPNPVVTTTPLARFVYAGLGRRVAVSYGSAPGLTDLPRRFSADLRKPDGGELDATISGLDRFGQVSNLHYRNAASTPVTLFRGQYGYDVAGNRIAQRITQATVGGVSHDNVRSQLHGYDNLQRLVSSEVGVGSPATGLPTSIASGVGSRRDDWGLDHLGNWVNPIGAVPTSPIGRVSTGNLDNAITPSGLAFAGLHLNASGVGYAPWPAPVANPDATPDTHVAHHTINQQNELQQLHATRDGAASTTTFAYDPSGNLTDDGTYRYQYDAWGRLLSVHRRATDGGYGAFIRGYNYDGLGRLTRAQSPYPDPDTFDPEHPGGSNRIERFYYDGVRRIQEVVIDPAASLLAALSSGSSQLLQAAQQSQQQQGAGSLSLEEESTPLAVEAAQQSNAVGGSQQGTTTTRTEREYVWGPGESWGVAGTDELIAQFDRTGALTFAITDAGGDLVAIVDAGGSGGTARVAGQWTYDAYGNVLSADHIHGHAYTRVGHKGLIFDRLDVGVADRGDDGSFTPGQFVGHPGCDFDTPRIVPFARGLYHNRNRVYMPELGRFAQADPNASGQTLLDLPLHHGRAFSAVAVEFDLASRFVDGGSLYGYLRNNSWVRSDPSGLFSVGGMLGGVAGAAAMFALPGPGDFITGVLKAVVTDYAANMEFDLAWAMDWSLPDDDHSRTENGWIEFAMLRGLYEAFDVNVPFVDNSFNPLDSFAMAAGRGGVRGAPGGRAPRGGWTKWTEDGIVKHNEFSREMKTQGWKTEESVQGVGRLDAVHFGRREILELKPFSPSGIYRGAKQAAEYARRMNAHAVHGVGKPWTVRVVYYMPGT